MCSGQAHTDCPCRRIYTCMYAHLRAPDAASVWARGHARTQNAHANAHGFTVCIAPITRAHIMSACTGAPGAASDWAVGQTHTYTKRTTHIARVHTEAPDAASDWAGGQAHAQCMCTHTRVQRAYNTHIMCAHAGAPGAALAWAGGQRSRGRGCPTPNCRS